jgi:hypothetical protein
MNRESAFVAFLMFLLFFTVVGSASAQVATPEAGVSAGNVFAYNFFAFWSSTNQTATVPAVLAELNKTETIRITITQVSGLMVFMNITSRFENGTENTSEDFVNIMSGVSVKAFGLIVSPKLTKNNVVYPYGDINFTINGTMTRTYSFGVRETAHSSVNSTDVPGTVYAFDDLYFDRETGVMLEWYAEQVQSSSPNEKTALLWKIKEFDLKTTGGLLDYWPLIVVVVAVVAVLIAVIAYLRRRRGRRRHRRRQPQ